MILAFDVPFEFIVEVFASARHYNDNHLVFDVFDSVCQLVIGLVIKDVISVYMTVSLFPDLGIIQAQLRM